MLAQMFTNPVTSASKLSLDRARELGMEQLVRKRKSHKYVCVCVYVHVRTVLERCFLLGCWIEIGKVVIYWDVNKSKHLGFDEPFGYEFIFLRALLI